jgi:phasin family protein
MPQTKSSAFPKDFAPYFADFKIPGFDLEAMATIHRKNVETMIEANRRTMDGVRALVEREAELMREGFERANKAATEALAPTAPEDKLALNADYAKGAFESGLAASRELYALAAATGEDVMGLVTSRIRAGFDEVKAAAANGSAAPAAKAEPAHAKK